MMSGSCKILIKNNSGNIFYDIFIIYYERTVLSKTLAG